MKTLMIIIWIVSMALFLFLVIGLLKGTITIEGISKDTKPKDTKPVIKNSEGTGSKTIYGANGFDRSIPNTTGHYNTSIGKKE